MSRKRSELPPGVMLRSEFAAYRKVAPSTVTRWISSGALAAPAVRQDGTIDVARADAMLGAPPAAGLLPLPSAAAPEPAVSISDKKRREKADADLAEIKAAEKAGELTDAEAAEREYEDLARRLRHAIMAVPRDIADDCAKLGEPIAIEARMTMALEKVIDEFSRSIGAGGEEDLAGAA